MSDDAQKAERWKKIRKGLSRQIKKTTELKKVLGGEVPDGAYTYSPTPSAAHTSSGSDTFTIAVSDNPGHLHGLPGLGIPLIIKPQD